MFDILITSLHTSDFMKGLISQFLAEFFACESILVSERDLLMYAYKDCDLLLASSLLRFTLVKGLPGRDRGPLMTLTPASQLNYDGSTYFARQDI